MTPEQTLEWLAQQHFDQCHEERPIQDWIRKMKSQLPEQPAVSETHKSKPRGYAGITIWGGDATVTKVFTETEMKFAREPRSLIERVVGQCLDELGAHGIVGDTHE